MALFKFSDSTSPFYGRIRSIVFTANSQGLILRNRVKPLLKRTYAVTVNRARFRSNSQRWRLLNDTQKNSFISRRDDFLRGNPVGEVLRPTGPQLQIEMNQPLSVAGLPNVNEAIDPVSFPSRSIDPSIFTLSPFRIWLYMDDLSAPADFEFKFWASPVRFAARSLQFPSDYQLIGQGLSPGAEYYDLTASYLSVYNQVSNINFQFLDSTSVNVALQAIHTPSGQQALLSELQIPLFFF